MIFAAAVFLPLLALPLMRAPAASKVELQENMGEIVRKALKDPSYSLIFLGFFSCGYQLSVLLHLPVRKGQNPSPEPAYQNQRKGP